MAQVRSYAFLSFFLVNLVTLLVSPVTNIAFGAVDLKQCPTFQGHFKLTSDSSPDFFMPGSERDIPYMEFQLDRYFIDNATHQRGENFVYKANCRNGELIIETEKRTGSKSTYQTITWSPWGEPGVFVRHTSTRDENGPVSEKYHFAFSTLQLINIPEHVANECPVVNGNFEEHVSGSRDYFSSAGGTVVDLDDEDENEAPAKELPVRSISTKKIAGGYEYNVFEGVTADGRWHKNALGEYRANCRGKRIYVQFTKGDEFVAMNVFGYIKRGSTTPTDAPEIEQIMYKKMGYDSYRESGFKRVEP